MQDRDDLKRILECVQQLPDDRREALIMRFALGMDNREIARALGRTDGATKVLLHRAIRQLEELVKKAEDGNGVSGMSQPFDIEARLQAALAPIEPPEELAAAHGEPARHARRAGRRRARGVGAVGDARPAQLAARRGPARPRPWSSAPARAPGWSCCAPAAGATSAAPQAHSALDLAERTLRDVAREALRVFEDAAPRR